MCYWQGIEHKAIHEVEREKPLVAYKVLRWSPGTQECRTSGRFWRYLCPSFRSPSQKMRWPKLTCYARPRGVLGMGSHTTGIFCFKSQKAAFKFKKKGGCYNGIQLVVKLNVYGTCYEYPFVRGKKASHGRRWTLSVDQKFAGYRAQRARIVEVFIPKGARSLAQEIALWHPDLKITFTEEAI